MAAQNDIWFHAHGYPGSHVILRREGRKEEPSAQTLKEAAGLAAYWSKGRTAKKVPVVYTLAKYVTKPKGSPPGLALLKREKTLMVEPALLPMEEEGDQEWEGLLCVSANCSVCSNPDSTTRFCWLPMMHVCVYYYFFA